MSSTTSSAPKKPKGILKKPSATSTATDALPGAPITPLPIEEHKPAAAKPSLRDTAIQQARLIQQQQALEDEIHENLIALSKFPLAHTTTTNPSITHDASNPSPADASAFRSLVRLFQPSDYEDLIEERNTLNKCGYALCPEPRTRLGPRAGEYKLVGWGRADFGIVPRRELERWCSRECARRAMYVKVQLNELLTMGGGRAAAIANRASRIDLLDEPKQTSRGREDEDAARRRELELRSVEEKAAKDARDLALERGDVGAGSSTKQVKLTIREKKVTMPAEEPSLDKDNESHLILDGYKTKFNREAETKNEEDEGDNAEEVDSENPPA